jgi:hypothetical protein
MKYKTKIKIGISLLIALFFIVPSGSIMAGESEADVKNTIAIDDSDLVMKLPSNDPMSQGPGEVYPNGIFDPDFGYLIGDIPEGTYDLWTSLFVPDLTGIVPGTLCQVKVFLEVYRKCCGGDYGEEIIMYETSFEDNFDVYNNWIQIDEDCGGLPGGHIDGWKISDARASDGDYSFKCTMYDIYKGNQDDILMCTKSFDITDQNGVKVEFDIWVDGSGDTDPITGYDNYRVYDYLSFEVGDWTGLWMNPDIGFYNGLAMDYPESAFHDDEMFFISNQMFVLEGAYHFFDTRMDPFHPDDPRDYTPKVESLGGGWWHVWWQADISEIIAVGLDPTDLMFRFLWHSDPENQFEGAYVDNFRVISLEGCEEKVFQTHTQGPVEWDPSIDHTLYVDFPLDWDAVDLGLCKKTCYDFKLWIQVVNDPPFYTMYDWPNVVDIPVCVGDFYDCGILDAFVETSFGQDIVIPHMSADDYIGEVDQGEDLHITTWVHLQGTVPAYDVPVKLTAYKKTWETLNSWDFESGSAGWEFGHFGAGGSLWHVTNRDAYSGSSALGCFDENTGYYRNNMVVDYALHGATYDVRDYLHLNLDYYTKYIFEDGPDYWAVMLYDAATNYVLGNIGGVGFSTTGYHPDWIGPDIPGGRYQPFNLLAAYDYWFNVRGFFRNGDGTPAYELGAGFAVWGTDGDVNEHPLAENQGLYWSGWFLDDISVNGQVLGEEVYNDIIIIPEMEPCETYEVQFEWEDVPYCDYQLKIECEPEGGCDNWPWKIPWQRQIRVTSDKENLHPKEVESIDYTDLSDGEWVISSSDYDNYIATNAGVHYGASNAELILCPSNGGDCGTELGDPCCIDLLPQIAAGLPVDMTFDAWWDLEGWPFDWVDLLFHPGCPAETSTGWFFVDSWDGFSHPPTSYWYTGLLPEADSDGWVSMGPYPLDLIMQSFGVTEGVFRFVFQADGAWDYRGMKLDDFVITNLLQEGFPPAFVDFTDPCDDLSNWCTGDMNTGQYWFHKVDRTFNNDDIGTYCNFDELDPFLHVYNGLVDTPFESFVPNMDDGLIWTTEIMDCYKAFLQYEVDYVVDDFRTIVTKYGPFDIPTAIVYVEVGDGTDWWTLTQYRFDDGNSGVSGGYIQEDFDISFLAGKAIQVRFRVDTDAYFGGINNFICIRDVHITGKQDHTAPMSSITMTGTMKDSGWYNTAVRVKITATDNIAMGEIHYILDGVETVVAGDTAEFTVSGNGLHTLEYWAVDAMGNAEGHHIVPPFRIDSGSAPTVAITAPEPGLYLFGNKILSASKVIIIGAFTIEATASDAESGIYKVQFYLDGDVIAEDTEVPFSAYCAVKHMGEGTIKVVAEDFAQNTAEDTLDITYYKFL